MNSRVGDEKMHQTETVEDVDYRQLYEQQLVKNAAQEVLIAKLQNEISYTRTSQPPMSDLRFEYMVNLKCKVKSLSSLVKAFETGDKYKQMKAAFKLQLEAKDRTIRNLRIELSKANSQIITVREYWSEIFDDLEKAHAKEIDGKDREINAIDKRLLKTQQQLDAEKDKSLSLLKKLYNVEVKLEEEKEINKKLKNQIRRDHETSSKPSSMVPNRGKITNNREKTDRKPGGQPGHDGHRRKMHNPTSIIEVPVPEKYSNNPLFKETGKTIRKQLIDIRIEVVVDEYFTKEFRNVFTGQRVHAEFPKGLVNDVTYGGKIKALAFMLNNHCNVSIGKVSDFINEVTGGELRISTGMINGLAKEFSIRTQSSQRKAFADMLLSPFLHVDFTGATVNGKKLNVVVCADGMNVLYYAKPHKGHKGIKGTPVENYQFTLIHDHELTFYSYGGSHQECLEHIRRYLKDSIINEPNLTWNKQMRELIQEMIHFRKNLDPEDERNPDEINPKKVTELESRYDEILKLAESEYEYEPPSKYYPDGQNLYERLVKYRDNHLLFLHDRRIPYTNNLAERLLRIFKRKQHQVMAFRSFGGLESLCDCLGAIASLRDQGKNLYESITEIFDTPKKINDDKVA